MSNDMIGNVLFTLLGWGVLIIQSLYMYYLRAPSIIEVRPELADVGFTTALFSNHFWSWVWYTAPGAGVALMFVIGVVWSVFTLSS